MLNKTWLSLIPAAAVIGGIIYMHADEIEVMALTLSGPDARCLDLYHDILPEDTTLTSSVLNGSTLRVYYGHAAGEGSVVCDLVDGELDDMATLNRKIDVLWDNPEIKPRFEP